jgi:hypothetical protein
MTTAVNTPERIEERVRTILECGPRGTTLQDAIEVEARYSLDVSGAIHELEERARSKNALEDQLPLPELTQTRYDNPTDSLKYVIMDVESVSNTVKMVASDMTTHFKISNQHQIDTFLVSPKGMRRRMRYVPSNNEWQLITEVLSTRKDDPPTYVFVENVRYKGAEFMKSLKRNLGCSTAITKDRLDVLVVDQATNQQLRIHVDTIQGSGHQHFVEIVHNHDDTGRLIAEEMAKKIGIDECTCYRNQSYVDLFSNTGAFRQPTCISMETNDE